jgi:PAS domain S-box-containing protein
MKDKKILIVEDEISTVLYIKDILEGRGYQIAGTATSGEEAINLADEGDPDIVIMDVIMEGAIDGIDAAKAIRARHDIPIIYLTASTDEKNLNRAKETEPHGYLIKPIDEYELYTVVETVLLRHNLEKKLKEKEERYRAQFVFSSDAIILLDEKGSFDCNNAALSIFGISDKDEFISMTTSALYPLQQFDGSDSMALMRQKIDEAFESGSNRFEWIFRRKNGEDFYADVLLTRLSLKGRNCIQATIRDITDRKRAENNINNLLSSIPSILIGISLDNTITHWNKAAEDTFGFEASEVLGHKINDFDITWDWECIHRGIEQCYSTNCPRQLSDIAFLNREGGEGFLGISITMIRDHDGAATGFLIYGRDITDKRIMEQQLMQSSKMASIGEMATGVAHELNQPLNVIKIAAQLIKDSIVENDFTEEFIAERSNMILQQVERASGIINHLRIFGRKGDDSFAVIDPNKPIIDAFNLLGEQLQQNAIRYHLNLDADRCFINGDSNRLEQVFINFIINAMDAFEESGSDHPKQITVTSCCNSDNNAITIDFENNGPGIPDDIINRIFDPFFTTKEVGKGTGIGLSISYSIIKSHNGSIKVRSGKTGTVFAIELPTEKK